MNFVFILVLLTRFGIVWAPELLGNGRAEAFAGCYRLELGRWSRLWIFPATPLAGQIPPAEFQLSSRPVDLPNRFRISPNTTIHGAPSRLDSWTVTSGQSNTVDITWTDGFTGVSLHLKSETGRLRGFATAYSDASGLLPFPSARAVAFRVACESKK
jgi:hypothetical protein